MSILGYSVGLSYHDEGRAYFILCANIRGILMTSSRPFVGAIAANSTSLIGSPEATNKDVSGYYFLFGLVMANCSDR